MSETESAFLGFITQYGKSYSSLAEYEHRFMQFARSHAAIVEHNTDAEARFTLGHNQMSDWTEEEYKGLLTYQPYVSAFEETELFHHQGIDTAGTIDWRDLGAVNEVQDQGACGSCWTFSTMASFEGAHFVASGKLQKFAEQQLVDCVSTMHGCNGGNVTFAGRHLNKHDANLESAYPYKAKQGTCVEKDNTGIRNKSVVNVAQKDATAMKAALQQSVLSVAIQADQRVFQSYKSGIFDSVSCGTQLDHATNVVGWGVEQGVEYWIMRNSWSSSWGEGGYMRILIAEGEGICGIQMLPQYLVAKN